MARPSGLARRGGGRSNQRGALPKLPALWALTAAATHPRTQPHTNTTTTTTITSTATTTTTTTPAATAAMLTTR